jgi:hypothetical protein
MGWTLSSIFKKIQFIKFSHFLSHYSSKRTVDFGLSRGYSGAQEAKHRMAMQIANFAGGPGRKKRLSPGKFATQI